MINHALFFLNFIRHSLWSDTLERGIPMMQWACALSDEKILNLPKVIGNATLHRQIITIKFDLTSALFRHYATSSRQIKMHAVNTNDVFSDKTESLGSAGICPVLISSSSRSPRIGEAVFASGQNAL